MKRISLLLFSALLAVGVSAQEVKQEEDVEEVRNVSNGTVYLKNRGCDNWFIGIGGGTNIYTTSAERDGDDSFGKRLGWQGQLEVGRWCNPKWGGRLVIDAGYIQHDAEKVDDQTWVGGHFDILFNPINAWGSYNPERVYSIIPYGGVGYMYGLDDDWKKLDDDGTFKDQDQTLTFNLGMINNFQINKNIGLFLELGYRVVQGSFERHANGHEYDSFFTANAGIKFGLGGKQDFTPAELMDYTLINDLNNQINKLRAENDQLRLRPESCPDCPEVQPSVVNENVYVPNVVFFRLNSYKIDKGQQVSIYNTADYLKNHANAKVNIVAYADKKTGTPAYNLALSEKRAKAVASALIKEYGIDSDRITVDWKGDTEQPYSENAWNRVAIFYAE